MVTSKKVKNNIDLIYAYTFVVSSFYVFCLFFFESFRNFVYLAEGPDVGFYIMYNHVMNISPIFRWLRKYKGQILIYICFLILKPCVG